MIAKTPEPPYYLVAFTSLAEEVSEEYEQTAKRMVELAQQQEGFLGYESARDSLGITLSYWKDEASIKAWKQNWEHLLAQQKGRSEWYRQYAVRIAKVERAYNFET